MVRERALESPVQFCFDMIVMRLPATLFYYVQICPYNPIPYIHKIMITDPIVDRVYIYTHTQHTGQPPRDL